MTTEPPPPLGELLAAEIEGRLSLLCEKATPRSEIRAALHALKGSAAMAGEDDLALLIGQASQRLRSGDDEGVDALVEVFRDAAQRLRSEGRAFATRWPEPPPGMVGHEVDGRFREEYVGVVSDRLDRLLELASDDGEETELLQQAYRIVHGIKGSAASLGDDAVAWYCHGLETLLKSRSGGFSARKLIDELPAHQVTIRRLLQDPNEALNLLRASARHEPNVTLRASSRAPSRSSGRSSGRPSAWPGLGETSGASTDTIRVPVTTFDLLLEQAERLDLVRDEVIAVAGAIHQDGRHFRKMKSDLLEVARSLGPAKPGEAAHASLQSIAGAAERLGSMAERFERRLAVAHRATETLHDASRQLRQHTTALQRTSVSWLFERVARGAEQLAAREERAVRVETSGGELAVDRPLAERLFDPMMQLVRNAVAHGIGTPQQRASAGKPPIGLVRLRAEELGDWLRLQVNDDGLGVDMPALRQLAVARGVLTQEAAANAGESELLAVLFLPGMTTRQEPDLLAGRGVGLDLAQDVVRRLGGAMRIASTSGSGLTATLEVPTERHVVDLLFVHAGGREFALPVAFAGHVQSATDDQPTMHLAACLGLAEPRTPALRLELVIPGVEPVAVGLDGVGPIQEARVRPIPPLVLTAGPYLGAVLRSDGTLDLVLDAALLAATLWARTSSPPTSSR